jgi:uncharacterized damage-inducible protein DinB
MDQHLVHRVEPPLQAAERPMLEAWLEYHRATLARKCEGLDDEQLRLRSVPPSVMSLVGLVRHMAEVERYWFRVVLTGERVADLYCTDLDRDADFNDVDEASGAEAFATWRAECDLARAIAARQPDLDACGARPGNESGPDSGQPISLRWILVHMVEEYARHNGHADLLRERIDGSVGD